MFLLLLLLLVLLLLLYKTVMMFMLLHSYKIRGCICICVCMICMICMICVMCMICVCTEYDEKKKDEEGVEPSIHPPAQCTQTGRNALGCCGGENLFFDLGMKVQWKCCYKPINGSIYIRSVTLYFRVIREMREERLERLE